MELFVSDGGQLRGTFVILENDETESIQGALNKRNQRIAWAIGDKTLVFDSGLYDLSRGSCTVLVHGQEGQAEIWRMVSVERKE